MGSASIKLVISLVLVVIGACLAQDKKPADEEPVKVTYDSDKVKACAASGCVVVSNKDVEKDNPKTFFSEENVDRVSESLKAEEGAVVPRCQVSNPKPGACPRCTWDDQACCCPTCHYYARVPSVIKTSDGRPCYVIQLGNRHQYTRNGLCKNAGGFCKYVFTKPQSYKCTCQQQYRYQTVVCFKFVSPRVFLSKEWYRYPAYCSCKRTWWKADSIASASDS